ncbi:hypothetical protein HPB50_009644 [Hyalomma asiaticum]|uniref:Uncharacterized protein n=1 Tax=Hyalomma asiaticum TaxID=266040 RepID=A0ACB7SCY3_HYAAI|nr:hypothetical protein HPB50_009644 [Hyalomma asiaticum]
MRRLITQYEGNELLNAYNIVEIEEEDWCEEFPLVRDMSGELQGGKVVCEESRGKRDICDEFVRKEEEWGEMSQDSVSSNDLDASCACSGSGRRRKKKKRTAEHHFVERHVVQSPLQTISAEQITLDRGVIDAAVGEGTGSQDNKETQNAAYPALPASSKCQKEPNISEGRLAPHNDQHTAKVERSSVNANKGMQDTAELVPTVSCLNEMKAEQGKPKCEGTRGR